MAYKKDKKRQCDHQGCPKNARYDVFNTWNGLIGFYCLRHADWQVASLNLAERGPVQRVEECSWCGLAYDGGEIGPHLDKDGSLCPQRSFEGR